ncbi:HlyC/CorC family transporter OS=Streptomyces rimosus subsp. rimosus (strain ATCC / DSM 40260 / JCM 4667 / NRRL 2234) OX=1265868 GN=SRIM_003790 PE=4 SV=1 [Streptomyces rimosus subsp. rimosus]
MRAARTHLAAVIGKDGRLAGLVTMEDVLRELVLQQQPRKAGPAGSTARR